ncbi:MAG: hypothetical protein RIM23_29605 [Coleofasciculus sp. G3-WIS-01]
MHVGAHRRAPNQIDQTFTQYHQPRNLTRESPSLANDTLSLANDALIVGK